METQQLEVAPAVTMKKLMKTFRNQNTFFPQLGNLEKNLEV